MTFCLFFFLSCFLASILIFLFLADSKEEYDAWLADKTSSIGVNHTVRFLFFSFSFLSLFPLSLSPLSFVSFSLLFFFSLFFFPHVFLFFSPICFLGTEDDGEYIGDADEFIKYLGERFPNEVGGKRDSGCMIQ